MYVQKSIFEVEVTKIKRILHKTPSVPSTALVLASLFCWAAQFRIYIYIDIYKHVYIYIYICDALFCLLWMCGRSQGCTASQNFGTSPIHHNPRFTRECGPRPVNSSPEGARPGTKGKKLSCFLYMFLDDRQHEWFIQKFIPRNGKRQINQILQWLHFPSRMIGTLARLPSSQFLLFNIHPTNTTISHLYDSVEKHLRLLCDQIYWMAKHNKRMQKPPAIVAARVKPLAYLSKAISKQRHKSCGMRLAHLEMLHYVHRAKHWLCTRKWFVSAAKEQPRLHHIQHFRVISNKWTN